MAQVTIITIHNALPNEKPCHMFEIGFSELILIGIVALVVLGPERLPKAARTVGYLLARLQRYVTTVKADLTQHMQIDELRQLGQDVQQQAQTLQHQVRQQWQTTQQEFQQIHQDVTTLPSAESDTIHPEPMPEQLELPLENEPSSPPSSSNTEPPRV